MKVNRVYSPDIYKKIMLADSDKKDDIYRYDMMMPFQGKWDCYHIPLKPKFPGGYDIIMANNRLGIMAPSDVDSDIAEQIEQLENQEMWESCNRAIEEALTRFENQGIELKVQEYLFTILLANPQNAYTIMNEGYCGDGGIPGYIMGWLVPSKETIKRLPAALTHETNHNIRYQYIKWTNDINLGEMIVSEGLAENFATTVFGEELLGPWVTKTDMELMPLIKEIIYDGIEVTGFDNITSYLYGDEMARIQHFPEVGLPYCAGYANKDSLCSCDYCRNYYKEVKAAYSELSDHLAGMGVDIEKPFETIPLEPYEGNIEYIAVQYIVIGNAADFKSEDVYGVHISIADSHPMTDIDEEHYVIVITPIRLKWAV